MILRQIKMNPMIKFRGKKKANQRNLKALPLKTLLGPPVPTRHNHNQAQTLACEIPRQLADLGSQARP
jgi:hypothetical protein